MATASWGMEYVGEALLSVWAASLPPRHSGEAALAPQCIPVGPGSRAAAPGELRLDSGFLVPSFLPFPSPRRG